MCDEVDVSINRPFDEDLVLVGQRWQVDVHIRDIDTLLALDHAGVAYNALELLFAFCTHNQLH